MGHDTHQELPEDCRPTSRAEGYAAAAAVAGASGSRIAGWKIAATSEAGQKHINVDGPIIGRILERRLLKPGSQVTLGDNIMKVAEAEFAFSFGRDLPPPPRALQLRRSDGCGGGPASLDRGAGQPLPGFHQGGAAQLIADTACASWLVLGPALESPWRHIDFSAHVVKGLRNGEKVAEGTGKAVLGDPRKALTWFVNEAATYCGGVKAGQFVTTGTCIVPMAIKPGDQVTIDYGELGTMSCGIA